MNFEFSGSGDIFIIRRKSVNDSLIFFQVWFYEMGASSLNVLLYVFFVTDDRSTELRERERLLLDIMRLADQLEVSFAFPTRTLHVYHEQADGTHLPAALPKAETDEANDEIGIDVAKRVMAEQKWLREKPAEYEFKIKSENAGEEDSKDTGGLSGETNR